MLFADVSSYKSYFLAINILLSDQKKIVSVWIAQWTANGYQNQIESQVSQKRWQAYNYNPQLQ